jgi:hypothetical protein
MNADERLKATDDWVEHAKRCVEACEGINPEAVPKMREAMMGLMGWGEVEEDDGETVRISGPHAEWFKVFAAAQAALEQADDR